MNNRSKLLAALTIMTLPMLPAAISNADAAPAVAPVQSFGVAKAGGTIVRSCMTGQGYSVTYVL